MEDKHLKPSYLFLLSQKIEAPVRDQANPGDGGPPMDERLGANDKLFVQEDGAKEKALLGTEVALSDAMRCGQKTICIELVYAEI